MFRERVTRVRQTCIERGWQREKWREGDTGQTDMYRERVAERDMERG